MVKIQSVYILIAGLLLAGESRGQSFGLIKKEKAPSQLVYFEALGNGIIYSINYERFRWNVGNWRFGYRAGLGLGLTFVSSLVGEDPFVSVPIEFTAIRGKKKNFLSIGIGATYIKRFPQRNLPELFSCLGVGYKYMPNNGSIFFKIQPVMLIPIQKGMQELFFRNLNFTAAIGIGYQFKTNTLKSGDCN